MVKRKQKKVVKQKQKQKQNVNVKQNVKVVVGDVKRKQVRKATGTKAGASSKPNIVLSISNPQPYNNPYMMFFKDQLQNQQPIQANTLKEQVKQNEREENKASKAGALHKLDQEPNDVARELIRQASETRARIQLSEGERQKSMSELRNSLKPVSERKINATPLRPRQKTQRELLMENIRTSVPPTPSIDETENDIISNLQNQTRDLEFAMSNAPEEDDDEQVEEQQQPYQVTADPIPPPVKPGRGRKKGIKNKTAEQKAEEAEEKRQRAEQREAQRLQRQQLKDLKSTERKRASRRDN